MNILTFTEFDELIAEIHKLEFSEYDFDEFDPTEYLDQIFKFHQEFDNMTLFVDTKENLDDRYIAFKYNNYYYVIDDCYIAVRYRTITRFDTKSEMIKYYNEFLEHDNLSDEDRSEYAL